MVLPATNSRVLRAALTSACVLGAADPEGEQLRAGTESGVTRSNMPCAATARGTKKKGAGSPTGNSSRRAAPTSACIHGAAEPEAEAEGEQPRAAPTGNSSRRAAPTSACMHGAAEPEAEGEQPRAATASGVTKRQPWAATVRGDKKTKGARPPAEMAGEGLRRYANLLETPVMCRKKYDLLLFEDEAVDDEALAYCFKCCKFLAAEDHCACGHENEVGVLDAVKGRPCIRMREQNSFKDIFDGVECLLQDGTGKMVPLRPRSGPRCAECLDILDAVARDGALFCTFECRVRSGDAAGHHKWWAADLLTEDFSIKCAKMNRICEVFPPQVFCGRCCGSHHLCSPYYTRLPPGVRGWSWTGCLLKQDGGIAARHVSDPNGGQCKGVCSICNRAVDSVDHMCFRSTKLFHNRDGCLEAEMGHNRDGFCLDCCRSFSTAMCTHHSGHRWLRLILRAEKYCVLVPDTVDSWTFTAFDAIQSFKDATAAPGCRIVPLRRSGNARCGNCKCMVLKDGSVCSFLCRLREVT